MIHKWLTCRPHHFEIRCIHTDTRHHTQASGPYYWHGLEWIKSFLQAIITDIWPHLLTLMPLVLYELFVTCTYLLIIFPHLNNPSTHKHTIHHVALGNSVRKIRINVSKKTYDLFRTVIDTIPKQSLSNAIIDFSVLVSFNICSCNETYLSTLKELEILLQRND